MFLHTLCSRCVTRTLIRFRGRLKSFVLMMNKGWMMAGSSCVNEGPHSLKIITLKHSPPLCGVLQTSHSLKPAGFHPLLESFLRIPPRSTLFLITSLPPLHSALSFLLLSAFYLRPNVRNLRHKEAHVPLSLPSNHLLQLIKQQAPALIFSFLYFLLFIQHQITTTVGSRCFIL